jgi:hypothetical protein
MTGVCETETFRVRMKALGIVVRIAVTFGAGVVGGWLLWAMIALACYQPHHEGDPIWLFWFGFSTIAIVLLLYFFRARLFGRTRALQIVSAILVRIVVALGAGVVAGFLIWVVIATWVYDTKPGLNPVWVFWLGFSTTAIGLLLLLLRAWLFHRSKP